jgi:cytochrome b subunit of formate dehydrogenase
MANNEKFEYTYSAKNRQEIEKIRKKYLPHEEDKMEKLRRLDRQAERKGTVISLFVGIIGTLIFGLGMCLCLEWSVFFWGVILGISGMVILAAAYPLYSKITKSERERIAPEILRLTEEMSQ